MFGVVMPHASQFDWNFKFTKCISSYLDAVERKPAKIL